MSPAAALASMAVVVRLLIMCERPMRLSREEALRWLRSEGEELARIDAVRRVELTELEAAPLRFGRIWDWLIEIELTDGSDLGGVAEASAYTALVADMRLLGMRPAVAIGDTTKKHVLGPVT